MSEVFFLCSKHKRTDAGKAGILGVAFDLYDESLSLDTNIRLSFFKFGVVDVFTADLFI